MVKYTDFFFLFGCAHSMSKFQGQGSNLCQNCDLSHNNDTTRSLTHYITTENSYSFFFFLNGHTHSTWKCPGQGLNVSHTFTVTRATTIRFLTHCATAGTPVLFFFFLMCAVVENSFLNKDTEYALLDLIHPNFTCISFYPFGLYSARLSNINFFLCFNIFPQIQEFLKVEFKSFEGEKTPYFTLFIKMDSTWIYVC